MAAAAALPSRSGGASAFSGTYTFTAAPRPVASSRPKYRDKGGDDGTLTDGRGGSSGGGPASIDFLSRKFATVHDPRIVRGSTFALETVELMEGPLTKTTGGRAKALSTQRASENRSAISFVPLQVKEARREVNLALHLEEQVEPVVTVDSQTQTDKFLDRAPSPPYRPAKTGLDVTTQVEYGELFDFDLEVTPVVDVIVYKILEQSLMEVSEEMEMETLALQQREARAKRAAYMSNIKNLEETERLRLAEKEREREEGRQQLMRENEATEKLASIAYAKALLTDLQGSTFRELTKSGYFFDDVARGVEVSFLPGLMDAVAANLERRTVARDMADLIVQRAVELRKINYKENIAAIEAARAAEEARVLKAAADEAARILAEQRARELEEERVRKAEEEAEAAAAAAALAAETSSDSTSEDTTSVSSSKKSGKRSGPSSTVSASSSLAPPPRKARR